MSSITDEVVDEVFVLVGAVCYQSVHPTIMTIIADLIITITALLSFAPFLLQILVFFMQAGFAMIEIGSIQVLNLVEATESVLFEVPMYHDM